MKFTPVNVEHSDQISCETLCALKFARDSLDRYACLLAIKEECKTVTLTGLQFSQKINFFSNSKTYLSKIYRVV